MKRHYTNDEIEPVLNNLETVLKELNITEYSNSLYTEYSPFVYSRNRDKEDYTLLESTIKDTSYKLLDAIKELINVLYEWDYKIEARFDITINNKLSIIFHKPVVQYEVDIYNCKFR